MQRQSPRSTAAGIVCPDCDEPAARVQPTRTTDGDLVERRYIHEGDGPGPGSVCVVEPNE